MLKSDMYHIWHRTLYIEYIGLDQTCKPFHNKEDFSEMFFSRKCKTWRHL